MMYKPTIEAISELIGYSWIAVQKWYHSGHIRQDRRSWANKNFER